LCSEWRLYWIVKNNKLNDGFFQHVMMDVFILVKCVWRKIYGRKWIAVKHLGHTQTDTRVSGPRISIEEFSVTIWWVFVRASSMIWREQKQLDATQWFIEPYYSLNMFRALLCPSSGACDYTDCPSVWHLTLVMAGFLFGAWLKVWASG
jgi:hypothetical protein